MAIAGCALLFCEQESAVLAAGAAGYAQSGLKEAAGMANLTSETDAIVLIGTLVKTALSLLGLIFILLTLYAGWLRMTAQGSQEKIKKSNGILTSAVVGVIIIFTAYVVTVFVIDQVMETVGSSGNGGEGTGYVRCCVSASLEPTCLAPSTAGGRGLECPAGYGIDTHSCQEINFCGTSGGWQAECVRPEDCSSCETNKRRTCTAGVCGCEIYLEI